MFEVFRQWRTDYLKAYSKEFELAESSLGPLVLELLKRYNLNAINAFREPLLRNQVLRSLGNSVDERLFQDYFLSDTKHQTENATHIIFWLVLLSDPVRRQAYDRQLECGFLKENNGFLKENNVFLKANAGFLKEHHVFLKKLLVKQPLI